MWTTDLAGLPSLTGKPLLGLDVGEKTIGLALSDARHVVASPLHTIARGKFTHDAKSLAALCTQHGVGALVIGYPINMDGSLGPRTQSTRTFASELEKHIALPILLWDERMSTLAVTRTMLEADLSRQRRGELVDKLAAAYMLQGCLDALAALAPKG